jgi:hypothetical protein
LTPGARAITQIVDRFQDQKIGAAVKLLRNLPVFEGLGDGNCANSPGCSPNGCSTLAKDFSKDGTGSGLCGDARTDRYLSRRERRAITSVSSGQISGNWPSSTARRARPSRWPLRRASFWSFSGLRSWIYQHEPRLGLVILRNIALGPVNRLRRTNTAS